MQGIAKALRSDIFAAYAIADAVLRLANTGLARYRRFIRGESKAYRAARARSP